MHCLGDVCWFHESSVWLLCVVDDDLRDFHAPEVQSWVEQNIIRKEAHASRLRLTRGERRTSGKEQESEKHAPCSFLVRVISRWASIAKNTLLSAVCKEIRSPQLDKNSTTSYCYKFNNFIPHKTCLFLFKQSNKLTCGEYCLAICNYSKMFIVGMCEISNGYQWNRVYIFNKRRYPTYDRSFVCISLHMNIGIITWIFFFLFRLTESMKNCITIPKLDRFI